jgi:hypothetical protein
MTSSASSTSSAATELDLDPSPFAAPDKRRIALDQAYSGPVSGLFRAIAKMRAFTLKVHPRPIAILS